MNKPKVAVLLFGQARYIDANWRALKKEFSHEDGAEFDIFAHFWKDTGFSPKGENDGKLSDYTDKIYGAKKHLNIKRFEVDDNKQLDEFVIHIENILRYLNKQVFNGTKQSNKRYKWGQHLSLLKAYNLLQRHENKGYLGVENNTPIKYDIIIKGRTDFTYKTIECFKSEEQYYKQKADNYINFDNFDEPIIKTSGVQFQQYNRPLDKWDNNPNIKIKRGECVDFTKLDWTRDKNNIFRIADISLAANRKAAVHFFPEYLNVYLRTFLNDYFNRDNKTYDRHDAVQGDVTYYNKIKVYKTICRFFRLARDWDCKLCWRNTSKNGTVVFPSLEQETYEFILSEVKRISNTGREPAPFG